MPFFTTYAKISYLVRPETGPHTEDYSAWGLHLAPNPPSLGHSDHMCPPVRERSSLNQPLHFGPGQHQGATTARTALGQGYLDGPHIPAPDPRTRYDFMNRPRQIRGFNTA